MFNFWHFEITQILQTDKPPHECTFMTIKKFFKIPIFMHAWIDCTCIMLNMLQPYFKIKCSIETWTYLLWKSVCEVVANWFPINPIRTFHGGSHCQYGSLGPNLDIIDTLIVVCGSGEWIRNTMILIMLSCTGTHGDRFVNMPSQWEMTLQCNVISHWLGAFTKWTLTHIHVSVDWMSISSGDGLSSFLCQAINYTWTSAELVHQEHISMISSWKFQHFYQRKCHLRSVAYFV